MPHNIMTFFTLELRTVQVHKTVTCSSVEVWMYTGNYSTYMILSGQFRDLLI